MGWTGMRLNLLKWVGRECMVPIWTGLECHEWAGLGWTWVGRDEIEFAELEWP